MAEDPDISINELRAWLALRGANQRIASETLGKPQSTVRSQIKGLRQKVEIIAGKEAPLYLYGDDVPKGQVQATELGEALAHQAEIVVHAMDGVPQLIRDYANPDPNVLSVAASDTMMNAGVLEVLADLVKTRPELRLNSHIGPSGENVQLLRQHRCDVAFVSRRMMTDEDLVGFATHPFEQWPIGVVMSQTMHAEVSDELSGLDDRALLHLLVSRYPLILPNPQFSFRHFVEEQFEQLKIGHARIHDFDGAQAILRACAKDIGFSIAWRPVSLASEETRAQLAEAIPLTSFGDWSIDALWNDHAKTPVLEEFLGLIGYEQSVAHFE